MKKLDLDKSYHGNWVITKKYSLRPNQLCFYNHFENKLHSELKAHGHEIETNRHKVERKFHNFQISSAARKNLIHKISWMFQLAKSKKVKTSKNVEIFNFKVAFITLTLPSTQMHPSSQITSECLNQFITEIRERFGVENYVWRLEFQKNFNVHYHIVTDTFIEYETLKNIWNRILSKLGYIERYTEKMQQYNLHAYWTEFYTDSKKTFKEVAKIYAKSKSEGWARPNTVDVKSCTNDKSIQNYIAKYFAKSADEINACNPLDTEENSFALRLWFCSRSLSKLKAYTETISDFNFNIKERLERFPEVRKFITDYCTIYYFELKNLDNQLKRFFNETFRFIGDSVGYQPAVT
jgi:hypothetical protein